MQNKKIIILQGSIKEASSNQQLVDWRTRRTNHSLEWQLSQPLDQLPFFNPDVDGALTPTFLPEAVIQFRAQLNKASGLLIVSPEYVFSLPGVLKNALEWLVSTTILTDKPTGTIIAAASGDKAQESLSLILHTMGAKTSPQATLLIKGIKGKMVDGDIKDEKLRQQLAHFTAGLAALIK